MNIYIIANLDFFVPQQIASVQKFVPDAVIKIAPAHMSHYSAARELIAKIDQENVLIMAPGILLTAPFEPRNAVSFCVKTIVPKILAWKNKIDINPEAVLSGHGAPFKTDYENLLQDEVESRFNNCAKNLRFRTFNGKFLAYMPEWGITPEKNNCWQNCLRILELDGVLAAPEFETTASPGLGDILAGGLTKLGLTKERVSNVLGRDCGCAKRQEQLNELGKKFGIGAEKKD